jgi:hypothetical protein
MRVKVSDEIDGIHAFTLDAGLKLHDLIEPAIARGEEVVLDFEGVKHFTPLFMYYAIGRFIERDADGSLSRLFRYENLEPLGQDTLDDVVEYSIRRREDPRWAAAMDAAVERRSKEAYE